MLPPFADHIYATLAELARRNGGPVRTVVLADLLGVAVRTLRWYLHLLEQAARVTRRTPRSGWLPVV